MSGGEDLGERVPGALRSPCCLSQERWPHCYGTLFSGKVDSSNPAHKRMFMAMKPPVLRLGGYARETSSPRPCRNGDPWPTR